jgi:hypothetical protein
MGRGACAQDIEESRSLEHLASPGRGVHNPKQSVRGDGHVVRADQFAHACRIDSRDSAQIEHDVSLATTEKRVDSMAQLAIEWYVKRALEVKDAQLLRAWPPNHGHDLFQSIDRARRKESRIRAHSPTRLSQKFALLE